MFGKIQDPFLYFQYEVNRANKEWGTIVTAKSLKSSKQEGKKIENS